MTSSDVRDILDIRPGNAPRPKKKADKRHLQDGQLPKELANLLGERVPSVALQSVDHYKKRFTVTRNAQAWEWQPFDNQSREDGLRLKHWVRASQQATAPTATKADDSQKGRDVYHFAKYNHKAAIPTYTDTEYEQHLQSKEWTREETDYLFEVVRAFDLRWILIDDRYDYQPATPKVGDDLQSALVIAVKPRTMEDLKARYYEVAARTTLLHHPQAQMTEAEFEAHDCMAKFDPERERRRKDTAKMLLLRSPEEIKEEEILLLELRRIVANEEKFLEERQELYNRLDHPIAQAGTAMYETSAGLQQLVQSLYYSDKNKKRRSLAGAETSSPAQNTSTPTTARDARRDGPASATADKKKGSMVQSTRTLTAAEEKRFGVSTHERLNSGVSVRSSRVDKLILAKSQIQSAKLQDAIRELSISLRPRMPTIAVCGEYERLIINIHSLLDARKISEKINNEVRIVKVQKGIGQEDENNTADGSTVNKAEEDADGDGEADSASIAVNARRENAHSDEEEDNEEDREESKPEQDGDNDDENENEVADSDDDDEEEPAKASIESDNDEEDDEGRPLMPDDVEDEDNDVASAASPESPPADEEEEEDEGEQEDEEAANGDEDEEDADDAEEEEEEETERPVSSRASVARSTKSTRSARAVNKHKRSASAMSVSESERSTGTRTSKRARK